MREPREHLVVELAAVKTDVRQSVAGAPRRSRNGRYCVTQVGSQTARGQALVPPFHVIAV